MAFARQLEERAAVPHGAVGSGWKPNVVELEFLTIAVPAPSTVVAWWKIDRKNAAIPASNRSHPGSDSNAIFAARRRDSVVARTQELKAGRAHDVLA